MTGKIQVSYHWLGQSILVDVLVAALMPSLIITTSFKLNIGRYFDHQSFVCLSCLEGDLFWLRQLTIERHVLVWTNCKQFMSFAPVNSADQNNVSSLGLISLISLISSVNSFLIFHSRSLSGILELFISWVSAHEERYIGNPCPGLAGFYAVHETQVTKWYCKTSCGQCFEVLLGLTFVKKNFVPSPELLTGRTKLVWKNLNDLINACNLEATWQVQNWNMFTLVYSVRALAAFRPNYRVGKFVNQKKMGKCVRKGLCFKTSWVLHSVCCPKLRLCQHWDSCITFAKFPTRVREIWFLSSIAMPSFWRTFSHGLFLCQISWKLPPSWKISPWCRNCFITWWLNLAEASGPEFLVVHVLCSGRRFFYFSPKWTNIVA